MIGGFLIRSSTAMMRGALNCSQVLSILGPGVLESMLVNGSEGGEVRGMKGQVMSLKWIYISSSHKAVTRSKWSQPSRPVLPRRNPSEGAACKLLSK